MQMPLATEPIMPADTPARTGLLAGSPWSVVTLLMLMNLFNLLDRMLPAILAEPIKRDLGLSDTFLGAMNGIGFLAVYSIAAFPIARLADKGRYGQVISGSLALWSAMTACAALITSAWQLALTRIGVAMGEAGSMPASQGYVSRTFRPEQRPTALAVLALGQPLGTMAGLVLGGLLGERFGWRGAFLAMGTVGLLLSPLMLVAVGHVETGAEHRRGAGLAALAPHLRKRSVVFLFAACGLVAMGGYAAGVFAPAFLIRTRGMAVGEVGLRLGLVNGGVGIVMLLLVTSLGAWLQKRDARWVLGVLSLGSAVCVPFGLAAYHVTNVSVAIFCIAMSNSIALAYTALSAACLHSLVPPHLRAQASACLLFCSAALAGIGPLLTGMISDRLGKFEGVASLGHALYVQPASFALGALCYAAATFWLRCDLATVNSEADRCTVFAQHAR
jgi:predicted MFS family arabinose efflux permease